MPDTLNIERNPLPTSDMRGPSGTVEADEQLAAGSSAVAEKARHALATVCAGSRDWVTAHPGVSVILALCGGATVGWLVKRR